MTLQRLCVCSTGLPARQCPPECQRGEILPAQRDENGHAIPDTAFNADDLLAIQRARRRNPDGSYLSEADYIRRFGRGAWEAENAALRGVRARAGDAG